MTVRTTERQNFTPEQIRSHLTDALALVADLDVPDDLRVACFTSAVSMLSAKQLIAEQLPALPFTIAGRQG